MLAQLLFRERPPAASCRLLNKVCILEEVPTDSKVPSYVPARKPTGDVRSNEESQPKILHHNGNPLMHAHHLRRRFLEKIGLLLPVVHSMKALAENKTNEPLPPIRAITRGPKFHWRGYYDKLLFDPTNRLVLSNEVDFNGRSPLPADSIHIGFIDTEHGDQWIELGRSSAWNWQQGCMLQWVPGSENEVAWNDRQDGRYVSHILDIQSGRKRTLPNPFYCLSPDGKIGFAPDFRRLNDTRPGYGYAGVPDPNKEVLAPENAGIWRMDMQTGVQSLIFSFADAVKIPFAGRSDADFKPASKHWFNHLLCNTDGTRLFFLHRWHAMGDKSSFYTRALTMNLDGSDVSDSRSVVVFLD